METCSAFYIFVYILRQMWYSGRESNTTASRRLFLHLFFNQICPKRPAALGFLPLYCDCEMLKAVFGKDRSIMEKTRLHGIDAVRTTAVVFVAILHAISLSRVLDQPVSWTWVLSLYLRQLSLACVPLFLMISGYLQNRKSFSVAYYRGIIPLGLSYFVISVFCVAARACIAYIGGTEFDFAVAVYSIFNFTANEYAWYFEMYIGLFLLIPFLNMIYHGIYTRTGKHILLLSLVLLTLLPDTIAGFAPYYDAGTSTIAWNVFPDFFKSLYPMTFYFMGCYIAEFKPRLSGIKKLFALCAPLLPSALVALYTHLRGSYAWYLCNGFQTLTVGVTALFVFLALYDWDVKGNALQKVFAQIAVCSFEMYLLSFLWDSLFFNVFGEYNPLPYFMTALLVLLCSFISARVLRFCLQPIGNMLVKGYDRLTNHKVENL